MAGYIQVPADGVGKKVDTVTLTDELSEVHRQKIVLAGGSGTAEVVVVTNAVPASNDMGLVVRQAGTLTAVVSGTVNVNGGVAISGTAVVAGNINISATANIAGRVDVSSMPAITLAADQVLGSISRTVQVAVGTPFTIQGISTTVATSSVIRTSAGTAVEDQANNAIRVNVVAGSGSGFSQTDGTPFTAQEANFIPMGGVFDDDTPGTVSEGDMAAARITTNRGLHVNIRDASGNELGAASATGIFVRTATIALAADQILGSISRTVQVAVGTPFIIQGISTTVLVAMSNQTLQGISTTVTVVGVVSLAAGSILDSISATVGVKGQVSLAAGTSNIGIINNISATVTVAGNVNISATPSVILAAGTANFGTLNDISRTVQVAIATAIGINSISATVTTVVKGFTPAIMSATHGPKNITASTSANVTLIASPGAGANIYVTQIMAGNMSSTLSRARIGTSASVNTIVQPCAASGGGFVLNFDPPWMLTASEACVCSVKPNVADIIFTVNFFVI